MQQAAAGGWHAAAGSRQQARTILKKLPATEKVRVREEANDVLKRHLHPISHLHVFLSERTR
jgi:hypothetical protein